jgi:hypothetical protein
MPMVYTMNSGNKRAKQGNQKEIKGRKMYACIMYIVLVQKQPDRMKKVGTWISTASIDNGETSEFSSHERVCANGVSASVIGKRGRRGKCTREICMIGRCVARLRDIVDEIHRRFKKERKSASMSF